MARWRLTAAHYLNVPGTEYEYKETDRNTGKQARKVFLVPALLNPDDPSDCNYPGEIIVCVEGKGQGRDIVFTGPPTPDMEPLDDEAEAISASHRPAWQHPIDSLPVNGDYSAQLFAMLEKQMSAALKGKPAPNASAKGVDTEAFAKLQEQVASLIEQNAKLLEQLTAKPPASNVIARRA